MKALRLNQTILRVIGMGQSPENTVWRLKLRSAAMFMVIFSSIACGASSCVLYIVLYSLHDLENTLYALMQLISMISSIHAMIVGLRSSAALNDIFEQYQRIYNLIDRPVSKEYLIKSDRLCTMIATYSLTYIISGYFVMIVSLSAMTVALQYFTDGEIIPEHLFNPYKAYIPWDEKASFLGWMMLGLFCMTSAGMYFLINVIFLAFFMNICLNFRLFLVHFRAILADINREPAIEHQKAKRILNEAVRFDVAVKRIFAATSDMFSSILFIQLFTGGFIVSASVLQFDMAISHNKIDLNILTIAGCTFIGVSNLFLYCYFGNIASAECEKIALSLYESMWFGQSISLQKHFIVMIGNTQQPVVYDAFRIIELNLETCTALLKVAFQYYLVFKKLSN